MADSTVASLLQQQQAQVAAQAVAQQQSQEQQQQHHQASPQAIAPPSGPIDNLTCQWSGCADRCASPEALYVGFPSSLTLLPSPSP